MKTPALVLGNSFNNSKAAFYAQRRDSYGKHACDAAKYQGPNKEQRFLGRVHGQGVGTRS